MPSTGGSRPRTPGGLPSTAASTVSPVHDFVPAGVVLHAKPAGKTSHDVVAAVRRSLPRRVKVGHAGTLDPFATGLLLVLVGRATRAQRWFMALPKTYRVVARLGWRSDTGDTDGVLERTGNVPREPEIPVGELMQRPPAYSAVKVGGEPLYRKARRGEAVEGDERPVTVHRALRLWHEGERVAFEVECSSGTYVRQLVAALGDAYCEELERIAVGPFALTDADPERVVPLNEALSFVPERELTADEASRVRHGQQVPSGRIVGAGDRQSGPAPVWTAVRLTHGSDLIAVAEPRGSELQPVVVFAG